MYLSHVYRALFARVCETHKQHPQGREEDEAGLTNAIINLQQVFRAQRNWYYCAIII